MVLENSLGMASPGNKITLAIGELNVSESKSFADYAISVLLKRSIVLEVIHLSHVTS